MSELLWWFGQNTLAALLMIPCVMLACRLFRDRPAVQHLLWLVILLKFVTPPVVVWPWSVAELRSIAWARLSADPRAGRAPSPGTPIPERLEPRSVSIEAMMVPKTSATSIEPNSMPADDLVVTEKANENVQPTTPAIWTPIVVTTAMLTWFIGAIVCAVSQLRRLARYARLVRNGDVAPSHLKVEVASVASQLRMKAPVSLIVNGIVSPFLWCAGSARLAWPDSLSSQADVVRSRGIIAHELAHLRRRDHWITWLELGASILWWWNPSFWYVRRQLRETAEMSCDALAIAANPDRRREYAELLLRLSSPSTNDVPVPVIAMGAGNVASFERRLKMILSSDVSGNLSWRGSVAMAVLAVISLPYWSLAQSANQNSSNLQLSKESGTEQDVEIWSAHQAGKWPMPGGVTLEVKREPFHATDVATSVVLTWPVDAAGTTYAFSSHVASDAFANREPWHVAWESNSTVFWTIRGNLGDRGPGRAKLFCVNRIDFADRSKIVTTTWYHRPEEMPKGIQRAFEKVFEPLPTAPRRASEAAGYARVEQAHDVRPIEELLHGEWKSSSSELRVQMTFPEQDTGDIQWTIDDGKGAPGVQAKLSRIRYPADNSIRLWMQPSQLTNVDEKDIVGTVRRGPDSTLLLDITGSPKYPEYKKTLGIVLTQMPPADGKAGLLRDGPKQVSIAFNSGTALFDLDTEKKLGPMARGAPADVPQFDLYATWRGPNQSQLHAQVQRLIRVDNAQWDSATTKNIIAALQEQTDADSKALQVLSSANNPASTWLVQTKQGGMAILNIEYRKDIQTETNGVVEGFAVRYKLVSAARELGTVIEPWEISKLYESAFLQTYLQDHEVLPKPIVVPPVRGKVLDPDGNPASGVSIVSHTPRQWVDLEATLALKPHNSGGVKKSKKDGTFGLPERKEPYRVLLVHENGVANISHEDLLRANGEVRLQKWASITGTLKLNGKPQADETIVLHFDTLPWSYSRGGPRLTTSHQATTDNNGNFSFNRVPPLGGMAHQLSRTRSLNQGTVFQCESGKNTHVEMDAGNARSLTVSDNHDHQHDNVIEEGQPTDKPQLPRLIVSTVDSDGRPVPGTGVLFYDRNSHRTGQKQKFEMVSKRTDETGKADMGVMPDRFGCLQLSANKELAECYTLISANMTTCTQAKPSRANVQTEIKDGTLTVTFTMTPHVDLEFNIVDDATNEIVFWSEMFFQDPTTNRWWQFALVDGSKRQHNFIPISPQITRETIRISALGYETKEFRLPDDLDRSKPIRRDVRLKPMPDVELRVLLPDGSPADKAKLTVHYPNELDCLQIQEALSDAQGVITTKFPPSADIGIFRLEHAGETAELPMKELLDDAKQNPGKVIRRSIQLRKFKKQDKPVNEKAAIGGDQKGKLASWIPARPKKTIMSSGSASILDDHSIRLEGNDLSQEVTTHFVFDKPTTVDELRLELLPVDTPSGPRYGRGGEQLLLFDVKAGVEKQTGEWKSCDFSDCISPMNPDDETTTNCIDYLSDTGWTVPSLPKSVEAHTLVLRFEEPVQLQPSERLVLTVDSGGSKELAVLSRIRFAFHQASH